MLQESLAGENVGRQLVQKALAKIEIGTEQKRKIWKGCIPKRRKLCLVESLFYLWFLIKETPQTGLMNNIFTLI